MLLCDGKDVIDSVGDCEEGIDSRIASGLLGKLDVRRRIGTLKE